MTGDKEIVSSYDLMESFLNYAEQNCVLLMDLKGIVTTINKAFTFYFGYKEDDIIGRSASILYTTEDLKNGFFERELSEVINSGRSSDNNYLVNKDQSIVWVSGESLLIKNNRGDSCIFKVFQNINTIKISEKDIQLLNHFNESILSSIKDVVIVLDNKMNVLKANYAFSQLFKRIFYKTALLNFYDLVKPYDPDNYLLEDIQKAINTSEGFTNKQVEIQTESGEQRSFEVTCTPIEDSDDNNLLLIIHDITSYKQMEREREDIIGFVAHELRNPLSNIKLANDIMMEGIKENQYDHFSSLLEKSNNNVRRLNNMISELYEATKINAGYLDLHTAEFNFQEVVKEAAEMIRGMYPEYNIIIKGDGNLVISGDKDRLIQVITNYLSNGIKYSDGKLNVTLTITHDEQSLTLSVKDEGLGIPKEQLPFIFDRFFRVEKTRNIEGLGMGLYLCRQIIRAHNGKVWAESQEGKGSSFYFSIPLKN